MQIVSPKDLRGVTFDFGAFVVSTLQRASSWHASNTKGAPVTSDEHTGKTKKKNKKKFLRLWPKNYMLMKDDG